MKEYRHLGFESDEAFMEYHRRKAAEGDECSLAVLDTRERISLGELHRNSAGRGISKGTIEDFPQAPEPSPEGTGEAPE